MAANTFLDWEAYGAALERRGFSRIGSGHFSAVYAHPDSDHVIKVGHGSTRYGGHGGDGWLAYIAWARQQKSPFAPKVRRVKWHKGEDGRLFYVAVMEKLEYTTAAAGDPERFVHNFARIALDYPYGTNYPLIDLIEEEYAVQGLWDYMESLAKHFAGLYSFDFHAENSMWRADGTFVVTDPLSFPSDDADGVTIKEQVEAINAA